MKTRALALPAWVEDERSLLSYLMSPHEGHAYAEDLLDAVSLITSWVLVAVSILAVIGVLSDAILR
jgi:hypothetical protein